MVIGVSAGARAGVGMNGHGLKNNMDAATNSVATPVTSATMNATTHTASMNTSPTRRRGSRIGVELMTTPEHQDAIFESILARREGSVLARNTILKSEHYGAINRAGLDLRLLGAPNFRQADLNVFGVAQPTVPGLSTLLRLLHCGPHAECRAEQSCTWFSTREEPLIYINGRPFVLRDQDSPFENIRSYAGISASRLEQMELRLKADIAEEAARNNGLLLVHDEAEEYKILPCLTAIDSVKTSAEVFADMQAAGFCVDYKRVPISNEQSPTDAFIDVFVRIFRSMPTSNHHVIFSCGIGVGRTTYAMAIGMILRRAIVQRERGLDVLSMEEGRLEEDKTTRAVLRLVSVLEQGLQTSDAKSSAVQWTLARGNLIDNLKAAILGNYHIIVELMRVLENGTACKRIVDEAIDKCEALVNIREHILINRVRHSVNEESNALDNGIGFLERYFSLIAFCAYIEDSTKSQDLTFSQWIQDRRDVWNMLQKFRRHTDKLCFFRPVEDLGALSAHQRSSHLLLTSPHARFDDMAEYNVIKSRAGSVLGAHTILKIDHWNPTGRLKTVLTGAPNFRQIPETNIYASAQPTLSALRSIVGMLHERLLAGERIVWINAREEPVIYIDDEPYVLRDRYATLRNIRSYSGINAARLEMMEQRLKEDILNESNTYNNRLLVHCETASEVICPTWVSLERDSDVLTLNEIFADLKTVFPSLIYRRLPMTAEEAFEPEHIDDIMELILMHAGKKSHIIINCQMGASRSTFGAVVANLIGIWRHDVGSQLLSRPVKANATVLHYRIIHSILRVIRNGLAAKEIVDRVIDNAAAMVNLRDCIDRYRRDAESASDPNESRRALRKGITALKRYALLILFQGYLDSVRPDKTFSDLDSFSAWFARHQEFKTLFSELDRNGIGVEVLNEEHEIGPAMALVPSADVLEVVRHRRGQVLAAMTILKFDHFPGCQKMSLPERVDGAPNYREIVLDETVSVHGLAMPTKKGFVNILKRIGKPAYWCCLREEPVIYIKGLPYVLRITKDPVTNLEMTGIVSERVELIESRLKADILSELERFKGRLLLHEEDAGTGKMVAVWEMVAPEEVETTVEIVEHLQTSGLPIVYSRVPMYS